MTTTDADGFYSFGEPLSLFAQVKLVSQAEADLKKFEDLLRSWPVVRECHMLAGETDFLLKIVAKVRPSMWW